MGSAAINILDDVASGIVKFIAGIVSTGSGAAGDVGGLVFGSLGADAL